MKQTRMKTEARKEDILAAALPLAERHGYTNITRDQIAAAAKVSGPTLHYHFGTIAQLRRDLMRYAVREVCLRVIAQGLMIRDPQAMKAGAELRRPVRRRMNSTCRVRPASAPIFIATTSQHPHGSRNGSKPPQCISSDNSRLRAGQSGDELTTSAFRRSRKSATA